MNLVASRIRFLWLESRNIALNDLVGLRACWETRFSLDVCLHEDIRG
jgi:hypothetical protein